MTNAKEALRFRFFLILVALLQILFSQPAAAQDYTDTLKPNRAEALVSDDDSHPPSGTSTLWYQITLPDNWNITRPNKAGGVWYRIPVVLQHASTEPMGVMLANFSMNAAIWWDHSQVASGGQMQEPISRNWHRPLYASIPMMQAQAGQHWLYIYIRGYANDAAGLGAVLIGLESQLRPVYQSALFFSHTLSNLAWIISIMLALSAFFLWRLMPKQTAFFWVAVTAIFWALAISNFVVRDPPMPRLYWGILCHGAITMYTMGLLFTIHRILGLTRPYLEKFLLALLTSGWLILLLFADDRDLMSWAMPMHSVAILIAIYLIWISIRHWIQERRLETFVVGSSVIVLFFFGAHDWWAVYFANQLEHKLWMQFGPTLSLLVVGAWMIHRFATSMQQAEAHTQHIEQEIARVSSSLKQEQQQKDELLRQQLASREREQFSRELHDGLGGYLSSLSNMLHDGVQDQPLFGELVDHALLDMRLIMDGCGEECRDVGMLLGSLRFRLDKQLQSWGLENSWNLMGLPMGCILPDGHSMHLLRIIQEALTNVARHADASWVDVRATLQNQSEQTLVKLEIVDNGCGWDQMPPHGTGLNNIRHRAEMISASLEISARPNQGARIALVFAVSLEGTTGNSITQ